MRTFFAMPFVCLPIILIPFVLLSGLLVHIHLRLSGAESLRTLRSFMPEWESHRYRYKNQLIRESGPKQAFWIHSRFFGSLTARYTARLAWQLWNGMSTSLKW